MAQTTNLVCMLAHIHKKQHQEKRNLSGLLPSVISKWSQGTITAGSGFAGAWMKTDKPYNQKQHPTIFSYDSWTCSGVWHCTAVIQEG